MLSLAAENVDKGFLAFGDRDETELKKILEREEEIDLLNARLSRKISKVLQAEHSPDEVEACLLYTSCNAGIKRIHAIRPADTRNDTASQGLGPSARTQMGSVLDLWLNARSIWEIARTQKAIVCPVIWPS